MRGVKRDLRTLQGGNGREKQQNVDKTGRHESSWGGGAGGQGAAADKGALRSLTDNAHCTRAPAPRYLKQNK